MIVAKLVAGARRSQCARFLRSLSGWEAAQRPIWRKIDAPDTSDATKTQNSTLTQAFSLGPLIWKRLYSEGAQIESTTISELQFHKAADFTLDDLTERIEALVDDLDLDDSDVEHSQGVLTLKLGKLGTYVINKQTPNRQLWMSSPVSGPFRYDYSGGNWVYHRDGHKMHEKLEKELKALTGAEVDLNPCTNCEKLGTCGESTYCLK